jgi:hypothetical protein
MVGIGTNSGQEVFDGIGQVLSQPGQRTPQVAFIEWTKR